jgi:hypothetical protein
VGNSRGDRFCNSAIDEPIKGTREFWTKKFSIGGLDRFSSLPKSLRVEASRLGKRPAAPAIISMLLHGGCGYANF